VSTGLLLRSLGAALALTTPLGGCAGTQVGDATARDFRRADLADIPLRTLDIVVVSRSPVEFETAIDVNAFSAPALDRPIAPEADRRAPQQRAALEQALVEWAESRGFDARVHRAAAARPDLDAVMQSSEADALLLVRVVPVDRFGIFLSESGQEVVELEDVGTGFVRGSRDPRAVRTGRLLVGQAFLFEPRSRVRLWSRQVPDFPKKGRLVPRHPFLRYGFVLKEGAQTPTEVAKAREAARRFVPAMMAPFPEPRAGDVAARRRLLDIDLDREQVRQRFLDENHFAVEVAGGWAYEGVRTESRGVQNQVGPNPSTGDLIPLPDLGTSDLASSGMFRVVEPRVTWFTPGNFPLGPPRGLPGTFTLGARFSHAVVPNDFSRTALIPAVDEEDSFDQVALLEVGSGTRWGGALLLGWALWVSPSLMLTPEMGGFVDVLEYDTTLQTLPNDVLLRGGAEVGFGAMIRITPWLFARPRVSGRVGADGNGGIFGGFGASAGVGVLF